MADCTNEIEIEKTSFHIKDNVFTKLFEFLETLNRTLLDIPINLNIRYTPLPKSNISPYIRVGGSYHIAWGDFVKRSKPGFLGALGVEFLRSRKVSFGVEAAYDSAEITFDKYDNLGGTLFSKGEKNIKPGNFIFGLYIIF